MTNRTAHTATYLKDDRRSFFGSPKKLAKAIGKSTSADSSLLAPSLHSGSTTSHPLSTTTSRSTGSSGSKKVSPQVVSSILNGMYAHPVTRQETRPVSARAWETQKPSLRLNSLLEASSMSTSEASRRSSDTKSQRSSRTVNSIDSSMQSHSSTNSIASTFQGSNSSGSVSTRSVKRGKGSRTPSTSSQSSGSSGSTLRVMGRGGSGSRLRLVAPQYEDSGSPPRPQDASLVPRKEILVTRPVVSDRPVFIPPTGRGGSGSRPKPHGSPSTFLTILNKGSIKRSNTKGKEPAEPRNVHPITPQLSYRITNDSSSTINSSIHFTEETGFPPTPFFPNDRPIRGARSAEELSLSPAFSASSSTLSTAPLPSTPTTTILDGESDDLDAYDDEFKPSIPVDHRQRSLNKLTRTLGGIPPDNILLPPRSDSLPGNEPPLTILIDSASSRKDRSTKVSRRSSLSITSLSSIFVRPSGRPRDSVATHHTMSTLTDDLHQLGVEGELSDLNESSSDTCQSPGSPIMFSPPSPIPAHGLSAARSNLGVRPFGAPPPEVEQEESGDFVHSPTLSRSHSYTTASRRRSVRMSSHNHTVSASLLSDIRVDGNGPPLSNWIIPPSIDDDEVAFSITHNVPDKPQTWTGEWNSDMQDVIRSLRSLR